MAKLSSREQAAKKLGVAVNYGKSAKQQGSSLPALQSSLTKTKTSKPTVSTAKPVSSDPYSSKEYKGISKALASSMKPSKEEEGITKSLGDIEKEQSNLDLSTKLGIQNVEGQAIPMGFVTGQTAAINKAAATAGEAISAKALPLKTQLANLQARRQAAQEVAKQQLGEYQNRLAYQQKQAEAEQSKATSQRDFAEKQMEFDIEQARLRSTTGTTAMSRENTALNALLERAAQKPSGGREWAASVAAQYGVDPNKVRAVTAQNGWETAFNAKFGQPDNLNKSNIIANIQNQINQIEDWDSQDDADKAAYIRSLGGTPSDFGL